jgi:hypothetical protein
MFLDPQIRIRFYVYGSGYGSGSGQDPSIIKQRYLKKHLDFYCFVTFYDFLFLKNDVNVPS